MCIYNIIYIYIYTLYIYILNKYIPELQQLFHPIISKPRRAACRRAGRGAGRGGGGRGGGRRDGGRCGLRQSYSDGSWSTPVLQRMLQLFDP